MSKSVNRVILIGNLGKDPELKQTASGISVANFSIATGERFKGKDGQWTEKTEWHNIVAWSWAAELASQYLKKGGKVYVEGRLQTRSWEKDGKKNYITEVVVDDLVLLGGKDEPRAIEPQDQPTEEPIPF